MTESNPMIMTTNPRLSFALHGDGEGFERALEAVGLEQAERWLQNRVGDEIDASMLHDSLVGWYQAETPEDRMMARADLAELVDDVDDSVAEILWDASMREGFERNDGDQAFDAVAHLAQIAERGGDHLTAAEFHIEFLNWRRQDRHVADPESIHQAFEEIIRLAEVEHANAAVATFTHAQSEFALKDDQADPAAMEGDWAPGAPPFTGWE